MINEKIKALSQVTVFNELTNSEILELAEEFQWVNFTLGETIIEQGQENHDWFVITAGLVEVTVKKDSEKQEFPVKYLKAGQTFGENCLINGQAALASFRAKENCRILKLDAEHFALMIMCWPKMHLKLLQELSTQVKELKIGLWEVKNKEFLRAGLRLNQMRYKFYNVWGSRKTTQEIEEKIKLFATNTEPLILIGEQGTGQQMFVWYLHKQQFGENAPFIVVESKQIDQQWGDLSFDSPHTEEDTILGHRSSLLDLAEGGTLFIRDINLLSPRAQEKLAEVLWSKNYHCRVIGCLSAEPKALTIKIIASLLGCFQQKYCFRPLRERKKDIPFLANAILEKLAQKHQRPVSSLDKEATKLLITHHYRQGNVTELIKIIERAFFLADGKSISSEHLFFEPPAEKFGRKINLLNWNELKSMIMKNIFPLWPQRVTTLIFWLVIILLIFPINGQLSEYSMVLAWGVWWPALVIMAFLFGRVWCSVCPISYVMEMFQKLINLNLPVPHFIKKYDYLITSFLFLLIFWVESVTEMRHSPLLTGLLLIFFSSIAIVFGVIFTRHTWCRYLCPLGAFIGVASLNGVIEVRADSEICLNKCTTNECFRGRKDKTKSVEGCPMFLHAPFIDNNYPCKLCLKCIRNCPNDALKLNIRLPAREIWHLVRVDQGISVFIGVVLAVLGPILYFESIADLWPKDQIKVGFTIFFWLTGILAAIFTCELVNPFKTKEATRRLKLTFALIPVVVSSYIAYQLQYVPGVKIIYLGLGVKAFQTNLPELIYVPVLRLGQMITFASGILLTALITIMVMIRTKNSH